MNGRKILVAGGTGLVGANLVQRLHDLGAQVKASYHVRPPSFLTELFVQADFTDAAVCVREMQGVQDLFICAAYSAGIEDMRHGPPPASCRTS